MSGAVLVNVSRGVVSRRAFLLSSGMAGAFLCCGHAQADSPAALEVLSSASVLVKAPATTFLIAITRAGNRLIAVGDHGVIIYSDDDGASWAQAFVPVEVTLTCVVFVTSLLGWAAGHFGVILHSSDGGKTWRQQVNGFQINQLALITAQDAAMQKEVLASPALPLALRRAQILAEGGASSPFFSLIAFNSKKILAIGAYRMAALTTDGGKTWTDWSLHIYDRLSHDLYNGEIIGSEIFIVGEMGLVFRSTDGGDTFPQLAPPASTTLFGVLGAPDGSILVFGVAGACFRSVDDGTRWTAIDLGTQNGLTTGRVLESGEILIASETGELFISGNCGVDFEFVSAHQGLSIFDLEQASDKGVVFVGGSGVTRYPASILSAENGS